MSKQGSYTLSDSQLIHLAISYAPSERHSELERLVLQTLVDANGLSAFLDATLQGLPVPNRALELCLAKLREAEVPIPPVFDQLLLSPSLNSQVQPGSVKKPSLSKSKVAKPKSNVKQQLPPPIKRGENVLLSRKQRRQLIMTLQRDLPCGGIYRRYGCDAPFCKRCANIFVSYPISKCSVVHANSEPCNEIGLYPHISHQKWCAMHLLKVLPAFKVAKGCIRNPQNVFQLRYIRSHIYQKLKQCSAPSKDVTPKQAERDEAMIVEPNQNPIIGTEQVPPATATAAVSVSNIQPSIATVNEVPISCGLSQSARKRVRVSGSPNGSDTEEKTTKTETASGNSSFIADALRSFLSAPSSCTLAATISRLSQKSGLSSQEQKKLFKSLGTVLPDDMY